MLGRYWEEIWNNQIDFERAEYSALFCIILSKRHKNLDL